MSAFPKPIHNALTTQYRLLSKTVNYYSNPAHYDSRKILHLSQMRVGINTALRSGKHNEHSLKAIQLRINDLDKKSERFQEKAGMKHLQKFLAGPRNYSTRSTTKQRLTPRRHF
jgi:hypothetical protein